MTSSTIQSGSRVKISGLESEEGQALNGQEGIIDHFSTGRGRYAVSVAGASGLNMIRETNLELLEESADKATFENEAAMMERLKTMGMPPAMLQNLTGAQKKEMFEMTQRQSIVERAKKMAGVSDVDDEAAMVLTDEGTHSWRDASDHVYLEIKAELKPANVKIQLESIHVTAEDGTTIVKRDCFQKLNVGESKWAIDKEDGKMIITLKKLAPMRWLMVFR
jgi:hypothetical protein